MLRLLMMCHNCGSPVFLAMTRYCLHGDTSKCVIGPPGTVMQRIWDGRGTGNQPVSGTSWKMFQIYSGILEISLFNLPTELCSHRTKQSPIVPWFREESSRPRKSTPFATMILTEGDLNNSLAVLIVELKKFDGIFSLIIENRLNLRNKILSPQQLKLSRSGDKMTRQVVSWLNKKIESGWGKRLKSIKNHLRSYEKKKGSKRASASGKTFVPSVIVLLLCLRLCAKLEQR